MDMPDSAAPGMVHEAAPRIEFDPAASVTLQCQHRKLFTIDGVRAHATLGYLPFEMYLRPRPT
eukprot:11166270-Lingulodinium_polyedra.AAC.1